MYVQTGAKIKQEEYKEITEELRDDLLSEIQEVESLSSESNNSYPPSIESIKFNCSIKQSGKINYQERYSLSSEQI